MNNPEDNVGSYVSELVRHQGVAVVTVSDGWVFTFSKEKLKELVNSLENSERVTIFVKSSDGLPTN
jgi:hypothetical protein